MGLKSTLLDIQAERARQDAKWGEQNHPSVDQVLMTRAGGCTPERMAEEYEIPTAQRARNLCNINAQRDQCTWAHIAIEELAEVIEAATLGQGERDELVQLGAVIVAWIEAIDRRAEGKS